MTGLAVENAAALAAAIVQQAVNDARHGDELAADWLFGDGVHLIDILLDVEPTVSADALRLALARAKVRSVKKGCAIWEI